MMTIRDYDELRVYREAYACAMELFEASKGWPKQERYALTDQIRRSSRAVCANVAEAWSKRRYERHFVSKLSDAEGEAGETMTWLRFAKDCGYLDPEVFEELMSRYRRVRGGLVKMMAAPEHWCGVAHLVRDPSGPYFTSESGTA